MHTQKPLFTQEILDTKHGFACVHSDSKAAYTTAGNVFGERKVVCPGRVNVFNLGSIYSTYLLTNLNLTPIQNLL